MKPCLALPALLLVLAGPAHGAADPETVARGKYLAAAGDCVACHTAPDGRPYAGGRAVESPFGDIYSSNITPDRKFGIGDYSLEDFSRAVRLGIRKDGAQLYPAMPYPSYAKVSDADIAALYAFFMNGIEPVPQAAPKTALAWPFSMRWGVKFWNWAFAPEGVSAQAEATDPLDRGHYLVESLGHCGSCHTPRGLAFQEKGYGADDEHFLAGAEIGGWPTPSLRAGGSGRGLPQWSEDDIVEFLATGRNRFGAVVGEMELVITHSTSQLTEADNRAIATFLKSLPARADTPAATPAAAPDTAQRLTAAKVDVNSGERLYLDNCNACHFVDGKGAPPAFPPLAGNTLVDAESPSGVIRVILSGSRLPSTPRAPSDIAMPNFDWRLSDDEVAKIASFVRSSWGNRGGAVTADQVAKIRKEIGETTPSAAPDVK